MARKLKVIVETANGERVEATINLGRKFWFIDTKPEDLIGAKFMVVETMEEDNTLNTKLSYDERDQVIGWYMGRKNA